LKIPDTHNGTGEDRGEDRGKDHDSDRFSDKDNDTQLESVPARTGTSKLQVAQSVGAAMLGVQSSKNRKRDFQTGKPLHFIIGGFLGTAVFILVVWLLVQYVLATS